MGGSKCCIPGCKTGHLSDIKKREAEGKKKLTLFSIPSDKLQEWKRAIKRSHRELTTKDKVCELHFSPTQICRYFVHPMLNGSTVLVPREKIYLVKDAVPSIFPDVPSNLSAIDRNAETPLEGSMLSKNDATKKHSLERMSLSESDKNRTPFIEKVSLPKNDKNSKPLIAKMSVSKNIMKRKLSHKITPLSKINQKRKLLPKRSTLSNIDEKRKSSLETMSLPKKTMTEDIQIEKVYTINESELSFTFDDLLENISEVRRPNKFWSVSSHEDFILCVKWDSEFSPERQIIVDANLGVKLRYCGIESPSIIPPLESVKSLSQIIENIDKREVCPGAQTGNKKCYVYMEREWGYGRPKVWCTGCKSNISRSHKAFISHLRDG